MSEGRKASPLERFGKIAETVRNRGFNQEPYLSLGDPGKVTLNYWSTGQMLSFATWHNRTTVDLRLYKWNGVLSPEFTVEQVGLPARRQNVPEHTREMAIDSILTQMEAGMEYLLQPRV